MEVNVLQRLAQPDFTAIGAVGTKDNRSNSVRPAPIRPAIPRISPACTSNETSFTA